MKQLHLLYICDMLMKIILLMIFCHIIDNFVLINKLEVMKQKLWWEDTCAKDGLNIEDDVIINKK